MQLTLNRNALVNHGTWYNVPMHQCEPLCQSNANPNPMCQCEPIPMPIEPIELANPIRIQSMWQSQSMQCGITNANLQ